MHYLLRLPLFLLYSLILISCAQYPYQSISEIPVPLGEVHPHELERIFSYPLCTDNTPLEQCLADETTLGDMFLTLYEEQTGESLSIEELLEAVDMAEEGIFSDITIQKLTTEQGKALQLAKRRGKDFYKLIVPDTEDNKQASLIIGIENNIVYISK